MPDDVGVAPTSIQHVLLDADGVLQHAPEDWRERMAEHLGADAQHVGDELWEAERLPLRGEGDFLETIAEVLARHASPAVAADLHAATWGTITQLPESLALVARLRAAGYGVHLGTNQHAQRAAIMRTELGYDELFDVSVYSWEIGAAKPGPDYFVRAAALIGVDTGTVLFVDDRPDNVEAARTTGMVGVQWDHHQGLAVLLERLAEHGVVPAP